MKNIKLKAHRERALMTRSQLSTAIGSSRTYIAQLETKGFDPGSLDTIKIVDALNKKYKQLGYSDHIGIGDIFDTWDFRLP